MSPPYHANPDRRPLPAGWITQYDPNHNAWFYVNTEAEPPITTWNHPLVPARPPPPPERRSYSSPAVPPNHNSSTYGGGYNPATGQGGGNGHPQHFGGYGDSGSKEYERSPQQNVNNQRGLGGLRGRLRPGHHNSGLGGRGGGGGYMGGSGGHSGQQQQPQVVYVEQKPASKGSGMEMLALADDAVQAGLLGGVLLGEAIEELNDDDDCYDAGYDSGPDTVTGYDDNGSDSDS